MGIIAMKQSRGHSICELTGNMARVVRGICADNIPNMERKNIDASYKFD